RQCVQSGIVYVAARTGLPIIPTGFGYAGAWRAKSWDRMAMPKPFSRVVCVTLPPIHVPDIEDREVLENYRKRVEDAMREATRRAEERAPGAAGRGADETPQAAYLGRQRMPRRPPPSWLCFRRGPRYRAASLGQH